MSTPRQSFRVRWNNHQNNILHVMGDLLESKLLTDVTLRVDDGRSIECHKMILAAGSTYFRTLFTQNPERRPFVVLSGVKYPDIVRIVEFIYKGEVDVERDQLDAMLKVADALKVKGLAEAHLRETGTRILPLPDKNTTDKTKQDFEETVATSKDRSKSPSPVKSITGPHNVDKKLSADRENAAPMPSLIAWPIYKGLHRFAWNLEAADEQGLQGLDAQGLQAVDADSQSATYAPFVEKLRGKLSEITAPQIRKRKMSREHVRNRKEAILRGVLKQDDTDAPVHAFDPINPESHNITHSSPANGNSSKEGREEVNKDLNISVRYPDHTESNNPSPIIDDAAGTSNSKDSRSGTVNNDSHSHEGKRYKKYSKFDLLEALAAVKAGMSASKASTLYKVPARTLYDKMKKLGYTKDKNRRSGNSDSARFPFGIGGNADGSIYGNTTIDNYNDDVNDTTDLPMVPTNLMEAYYSEAHDTSPEREKSVSKVQKTPSPARKSPPPPLSPLTPKYRRPESAPENHENPKGNENEVQDLSLRDKPNILSSTPPNIEIKEEIVEENKPIQYAEFNL